MSAKAGIAVFILISVASFLAGLGLGLLVNSLL